MFLFLFLILITKFVGVMLQRSKVFTLYFRLFISYEFYLFYIQTELLKKV